jgi:DNA-binding PadR family transcriptional regulator
VKISPSIVAVSLALAADPDGYHTGYGVGNAMGIDSRAAYTALATLVREGWLTTAREVGPVQRNLHRLTDVGRANITEVEAMARQNREYAPWVARLDEMRDRMT